MRALFSRFTLPKIALWGAAAPFGCAVALLTAEMAKADGIYMTDMQTSLTQESIDLLTDPSRTAPGAQDGDIVEFVLQARVEDSPGGPGVYFTTYVPSGVEVLGAWFVTDATGTTTRNPSQGGRASDGWGKRGSKIPFGNPFAGVLDSRQNDLYGDTGIFYSTDFRTQLFTADGSNIAKGPIGDPSGSASTSNGYNVDTTFFGALDAFNLWDADQVNAFGIGGSLGSVPSNPAPTSSATVINSSGQGTAPFGSGSPLAGPDTGYTLDNTGNVGPWQRIQYPGSQIADISDGPATSAGITDPPFVPDVIDVSSVGYSLTDSNPLPAGANAVRWSFGYAALNEIVYVKVRVRVNAGVLTAPDGVVLNFEANGSDNEASGSKDNHWRYFGPTVAGVANLFADKEIVAVDGLPYKGGTIAPGAVVTYGVNYVNLGNLPVSGVAIADTLSAFINTTGCDGTNPTLSNLSDGVTIGTISAGTADCPGAGASVSFANLPNVTGGQLGGLRGGSFTYDVRIADGLTDGTVVNNDLTVSGNDVVSSVPNSATDTVSFTTEIPVLEIDLDGDDSSGATGNDFTTIFTIGGSSVAAFDADTTATDDTQDTVIISPDGDLNQAVITLTNPQPGDSIGLNASALAAIAAGAITATVTSSQITLSGVASVADYEAAIELIQFNPTSTSTDDSDRVINVTVSDTTGATSNTAASRMALPRDYGDAPTSYDDTNTDGTVDFNDEPARHLIGNTTLLSLGNGAIDNEPGPQLSSAANGDDGDGNDDDESISSFPQLTTDSTSYSLTVTANNASGQPANLYGWIDFDSNGTFDEDEVATNTIANGTSNGSVMLSWPSLPADLTGGESYVRVRTTTETLTASGGGIDERAIGSAKDGEVEDYALEIIRLLSCPAGNVPSSQSGNASAVALDDGVSDEQRALDAPETAGTTADKNNSAKLDKSDVLTLDLGAIAPGNGELTISIARDDANGLVEIATSLDDTMFTSVGTYGNGGTLADPGSEDSLERIVITIPGDGAQYVRFTNLNGGKVWVDGVAYTDVCGIPTTGSISGVVWEDADYDGIRATTETGLDGVSVELFDINDVSQGVQTTAGGGRYEYTGLVPGDYYLTVTPLANYVLTWPDQGSDDTVDSDVQLVTNRTIDITVTAGSNSSIWDAGMLPDSDADFISDTTEGTTPADDRDGDGIPNHLDFDPTGYFYDEATGEIIPGGLITISGTGAEQLSVPFDGSTGYYQWLGEVPGIYTMTITVPPGYALSDTCLLEPASNVYDPTPGGVVGPDNPIVLGAYEDGSTGFMQSTACTTSYVAFDLAPGDPLIINNNIPLKAIASSGATATV